MTTYNYTKSPVALDRLTQEIQLSGLATALDYVTGIIVYGASLTITFASALSNVDKATLDTVVANHTGTPLPNNVSSPVTVTSMPSVTASIVDPTHGASAFILPHGQQLSADLVRLVGGTFSGTSLSPAFYTVSTALTGSLSVIDSAAILSTGIDPAGNASATTTKVARFVAGQPNVCRIVARVPDTGAPNNVRRWGAYSVTDGAYFILSGTSFGVGTRKNGVDSLVFALNGPSPLVLDTGVRAYEITYAADGLWFYQDRKLVHTTAHSPSPMFATLHLPLSFETKNTGAAIDCQLDVRDVCISRYGHQYAFNMYASYQNSLSGTVLKKSPGALRTILVTKPGMNNATLTVWDNTAASGPIITVVDITTVMQYDYTVEFSTGMTLTTTGVVGSFTLVFE